MHEFSTNRTIFTKDNTLKPVYVEHIDNWFLKLDLYYSNEYVLKNHLSICLR